MNTSETPNPTDVLRGLRMIRSSDPADRRRAIAILSTVQHDPRVAQVFEYLYENDPDNGVRTAAWNALNHTDGPAVPAPMPPDENQAPAPQQPPRTATKPAPRRASSSGRALFLLNPANANFFAKEMKRIEGQKKRGRVAFWLAVIPLLSTGLLWAYILDTDDPDDKIVITAVATAVAVFALLLLGIIRRRGGLRLRRMLRGQVTECTGRVDDDGDFKIVLRYHFRTPADKVITGQVRQIRNDLRRRPLPGPGTPVAVYYRSERTYRLL